MIHTVGPIWNGGRNKEEELLTSCYFHSMQVALEHGIRSIVFSSISTGVYSFPVELAAKIVVKTVSRYWEDNENSFDLVEWVLFDSSTESDGALQGIMPIMPRIILAQDICATNSDVYYVSHITDEAVRRYIDTIGENASEFIIHY